VLKPQSNDSPFLLGERAQQLPRHQPIRNKVSGDSWIETVCKPRIVVERGLHTVS